METLGGMAAYAPAPNQGAIPVPQTSGSPSDIRKAAVDFEAFFLAQVLDGMFSGVPTDGPFGGGYAEQVYRSLLTQEFGRAMSGTGGFGIADAVQREILRMQEAG